MTRDEVLAKLQELKPWLAEHGITRVRLFGSHARDEARGDSDVDLIADFIDPPDLWTFAGICEQLEKHLGVPVDLTTERGLHRKLRDKIIAVAIDA